MPSSAGPLSSRALSCRDCPCLAAATAAAAASAGIALALIVVASAVLFEGWMRSVCVTGRVTVPRCGAAMPTLSRCRMRAMPRSLAVTLSETA